MRFEQNAIKIRFDFEGIIHFINIFNSVSKRLTRSRSGKMQHESEINQTKNEINQTKNEAASSKPASRKPIRSHSNQDEEKCNMQ